MNKQKKTHVSMSQTSAISSFTTLQDLCSPTKKESIYDHREYFIINISGLQKNLPFNSSTVSSLSATPLTKHKFRPRPYQT